MSEQPPQATTDPTPEASAPPPTAAGPSPQSPPQATPRDGIELLGLVAYTELATFGRLAADAAQAPTLHERLVLSRQAARMLERQEKVLRHVAELGADPEAELTVFDGVFDDFDRRTVPSTWWEGILKGYVGHGVADDFCRLAADGLPSPSRDVVLDILSDGVDAERSAEVLARAATADPALASRLALWGRRLVGEALGLVQSLLAERPGLVRLVADGTAHRGEPDGAPEAGAATQVWVFSQLTAEHTRRMGRLGLAA